MRALIVDDHPIMRMGIRALLVQRWPAAQIVEAESLAVALAAARGERPDVAITDLNLPDAAGVESVARLRRALPETPILVLSLHAEAAYASRVLQLGGAGYLTKEHAADELIAAVERVLAGGRYITPSLASLMADRLAGGAGDIAPHEGLSPQETRVMLLLAEGRGVGDIAATMSLSAKTVSTYRARVLEKLGLDGNVDIAKYCLAHGLTRDDS